MANLKIMKNHLRVFPENFHFLAIFQVFSRDSFHLRVFQGFKSFSRLFETLTMIAKTLFFSSYHFYDIFFYSIEFSYLSYWLLRISDDRLLYLPPLWPTLEWLFTTKNKTIMKKVEKFWFQQLLVIILTMILSPHRGVLGDK